MYFVTATFHMHSLQSELHNDNDMRTYSSESNVSVMRVQQWSKLNVFGKDLKIIIFVME